MSRKEILFYRKWLRYGIIFFAVWIVALGAYVLFKHSYEEPLPILGKVPPFSLTAEDGSSFESSLLQGKIWVADFIFTRCAGPCPLMSAYMKRLQKIFGKERNFRLISFSVDPNHDTPEVLAEYASRYGADTTQWKFLTGDFKKIRKLAEKGFKLAVAKAPEDSANNMSWGDGTGFSILHSTEFVLVDDQMRIRGYYHGDKLSEVERLIQDIKKLL